MRIDVLRNVALLFGRRFAVAYGSVMMFFCKYYV